MIIGRLHHKNCGWDCVFVYLSISQFLFTRKRNPMKKCRKFKDSLKGWFGNRLSVCPTTRYLFHNFTSLFSDLTVFFVFCFYLYSLSKGASWNFLIANEQAGMALLNRVLGMWVQLCKSKCDYSL